MDRRIGFIGLGNMGLSMAKILIEAGYYLQIYNRTISKADALNAAQVTKCKTPAEAAAGVQVVISMLSEDEILIKDTAGEDGVLKTLQKGGVHISMSTVAPDTAQLLEGLHRNAGSAYIASPVFGRPEAAAAKKLWICTSGDAGAKEIARPVLEHLGQGIIDFGQAVGAANVLKITGNFMIMASLEMMAEGFTMAENSGLDRVKVFEFFTSTIFNAPIFQNYGRQLAHKNYEPVGFKARLGYKDARLAFKLSQQSETPAPIGAVVHNRMLTAVAKGWGDRDWIEGFGRGVSEEAGG